MTVSKLINILNDFPSRMNVHVEGDSLIVGNTFVIWLKNKDREKKKLKTKKVGPPQKKA